MCIIYSSDEIHVFARTREEYLLNLEYWKSYMKILFELKVLNYKRKLKIRIPIFCCNLFWFNISLLIMKN